MSEADKVEQPDRRELLSQQFDDAQQQVEAIPAETVQTAPEPQVEPPVWERPPASWKKDFHEVWTTADPKLKEYAWQREDRSFLKHNLRIPFNKQLNRIKIT